MRRFLPILAAVAVGLFLGCGDDHGHDHKDGDGHDDDKDKKGGKSSSLKNDSLPADAEMVFLKVEGMTWVFNCVPAVQSALAKVDGVKDVEVVLEGGKASIVATKGKVSAEQLIQAVANIPGGRYKATSK